MGAAGCDLHRLPCLPRLGPLPGPQDTGMPGLHAMHAGSWLDVCHVPCAWCDVRAIVELGPALFLGTMLCAVMLGCRSRQFHGCRHYGVHKSQDRPSPISGWHPCAVARNSSSNVWHCRAPGCMLEASPSAVPEAGLECRSMSGSAQSVGSPTTPQPWRPGWCRSCSSGRRPISCRTCAADAATRCPSAHLSWLEQFLLD